VHLFGGICKNPLILLVERTNDISIVRPILQAAGLPVDRVRFNAVGPKSRIARFARDIQHDGTSKYAALIDADQQSVPDAKELARQQLGYPPFPIFCAVPQIEAWLFADDEAAERYARGESAREVLRRLPPPELIPYPKQVAANVFGHGKFSVERVDFLHGINIDRAAARSPSLRDFLTGISDLLNEPVSFSSADVADETSRDIFVGLINEVSNSNAVLWRTLDGAELTANDLRDEIQRGTPLGRQYISEILRVARDMIARQSRRR